MKTNILAQIRNITSQLIKVGLSEQQTFPSEKNGLIYISGNHDLSIALKNIPYAKAYNILDREGNYNIKMIDGALIQMMYTFVDGVVIKSRLAFFPSPNLEEYQNNPDIYTEDSIYANITMKNIVPTPIRIDYDPDNWINILHPKSHLTIGQYKNCRIPCSMIVTPNIFIDFILRNFYNTKIHHFTDAMVYDSFVILEKVISTDEQNIFHISNINTNG